MATNEEVGSKANIFDLGSFCDEVAVIVLNRDEKGRRSVNHIINGFKGFLKGGNTGLSLPFRR